MIGKLSELELGQVEDHMSLVHGIALHLTQIADKAEQLVFIVDLKGLKIKALSNKMINTAIKKIISLAIQYFPELLCKGYIVNAPMAFSQYWNNLEPLMPPATYAKFKVTGSPYDSEILLHVSYTVG